MASQRSAIKARKQQRTAIAIAGGNATIGITNAATNATPLVLDRPAPVLSAAAPVLPAIVPGIAPVRGKSSSSHVWYSLTLIASNGIVPASNAATPVTRLPIGKEHWAASIPLGGLPIHQPLMSFY
jgi:hypothetical protein